MAAPVVSIGLGVRNGAQHLRESLDSLIHQTYKNFELIISDNASTDETQTICEEYARKDPRIRYVRQVTNLGGYKNFDIVLKESRCDYFMYASHDDPHDKHFIEKCLAKFSEDPSVVMVFSNLIGFDDTGRKIDFYPNKFFPFPKDIYDRLKTYILFRSKDGKLMMLYGLWKRQILGEITASKGFDMTYIFKNLFAGPYAFVDEVLFFKRAPRLQNTKSIDPLRFIKRIARVYTDRVNALFAPFFVTDIECILHSKALTPWQKVKLFLYELYAYIRSLWYGHM